MLRAVILPSRLTDIRLWLAAALVAAICAAEPATGHVDLRPKRAPEGAATRFKLEVENERTDANTREITLQLPAGVTARPRDTSAGWRLRVRARRLSLTAPAGRELTGHEARRFPITMTLPRRPGERLAFKVLQEYDSGEVVRWIGPAAGSDPAPRVRIKAAPKPAESAPTPPPEVTTPATSQEGSGDENNDGWVLPVVAAGGAGLLVGMILGARRLRRRTG